MITKVEKLKLEIETRRKEIVRETYQMSLGELINLYRDGELDIHPEFQRLYRWSDYQKVKLIESIMLNIPIPSIFVSQNEDGEWDVIDGVQRLSTIFEFVGILKDDIGNLIKPFVLKETDYLSSFDGISWETDNGKECFSKGNQLDFKRTRLDVIIVKKESDPNAKYELFQRLNTGGTNLSDQEVRNCLMIMSNKLFYIYIDTLSKNEHFEECLPVSDRKSDEQYRTELLLRLLISFNIDWSIAEKHPDLKNLLDKETLKLCKNNEEVDLEKFETVFQEVFEFLASSLNEDTFKKYDSNKFKGQFLSSAFIVISHGLIKNWERLKSISDKEEWINNKIRELYKQETYLEQTKKGARAIPRYKQLSIFSERYFRYED